MKTGRQVFRCGSGEYISVKMIHNNTTDCQDGDDEVGLTCSLNGHIINGIYCQTKCMKPQCRCPDLFHQKIQGWLLPLHFWVWQEQM